MTDYHSVDFKLVNKFSYNNNRPQESIHQLTASAIFDIPMCNLENKSPQHSNKMLSLN